MFEYFNTIKELRKLKKVPVRKEFLLSLRERFASEADLRSLPQPMPFLAYFKYTFAFAMVIVFVFSTAGAAFASDALPGDTLYPVKIFAEDVRENLITNPIAKNKFREQRINVRFREMDKLLEKGKNGNLLTALEASIDNELSRIWEGEFKDLEILTLEDF